MNLEQVKYNQLLNRGESLANLPLIIHNSILNWENEQRQKENKYFQGYEELSALLNVHPQTLRKYTNPTNPKYPPVNILISMCKIMDNYDSWNYLHESLK